MGDWLDDEDEKTGTWLYRMLAVILAVAISGIAIFSYIGAQLP